MPAKRPRSILSATALAVAVVALVASPAPAAEPPPTPTTRALPSDPDLAPAIVNSWALAPTGASPGEPGSRPYLSYEVAPGAEVKDSVTLFNYSNVQLTFRIYATDAYNNTDGQFDLLTGDKTPSDAGAWVTLPQANITVPALASATLPITVSVPPDAGPGDHTAGILAASQAEGTGPDGKVVTLDRRTGSRLYLRVAGPLEPELHVEAVHGTYHPSLNPLGGSLDVAYTVRNRGNVRLAAKQQLRLQAALGIGLKRSTPADVPELLPGNSVRLRASFKDVPAAGLLVAKVSLSPVVSTNASSEVEVDRSTRSARVLAVPWSVLALLLAGWCGRYARRAYLRHQREGDGATADASRDHELVSPS